MELSHETQQHLEQQQQRQRLRQVVASGAGPAVVAETADPHFFTRVWEAQGHAFGD